MPKYVVSTTRDDILFPKGPPTQFDLTDSISLKNGITILSYTIA